MKPIRALRMRNAGGGGGGGGGGPTSDKWRIYIWEVQGGSNFAALFEVEFRATASGADQATGGTASASTTNGTNSASKAFDNTNSTGWQASSAAVPQWLEYDFASAVGVEEVALRSSDSTANDTPTVFSVQYWDGATWQTYWSFTTLGTWATSETRVFTRAAPDLVTARRYWKLVCSYPNDGQNALAREVELRTSHGGSDVTGSGTAFGTVGWFSGAEGPDKAFNNSTADWWQPGVATHSALMTLGYDFGSGNDKLINEFTWSPHPSFLLRTPAVIEVQKSPDNVTYETVALFTALSWAGDKTLNW